MQICGLYWYKLFESAFKHSGYNKLRSGFNSGDGNNFWNKIFLIGPSSGVLGSVLTIVYSILAVYWFCYFDIRLAVLFTAKMKGIKRALRN